MSIKMILAVSLTCLLVTPVFAQTDDPFGANGANPFGGGASGNDPFGRGDKRNAKPPAKAKAHAVAHKSTDVESRIRATLSDETTHAFVDTPLQEALQVLSRAHNIPIILDRRALEEVGLTPDTPISMSLKSVSLRSFVRLMLRDLELTYLVKDEVMHITTQEVADRTLILTMYPLPKVLIDKSDQVIKAMQGTVAPASWASLGGPASAHARGTHLGGIRQRRSPR